MAINKSSVTGNAAATAEAGNAKPSRPESSASEHACRPFSIISKHNHQLFQRVCGHCLRGGALVAVGYSFIITAWRVRRQPQDLAFVAAAGSLLAALLATLRRAERLSPDSPNDGKRRRLQAAVWALSTALSCAFAYRVAAVMPPAMAVFVWCLTAFVALVGLYLLVLCRRDQEHEQYQALTDGDDDAAASDSDGDGKASAKISNPNPIDELV